MKKIFLLVLLFVLCIGVPYFWLRNVTQRIFIPVSGVSEPSLTRVADYLMNKKPLNILLLGYGGGNHDGAYLTDSILVAHIDSNLKVVSLLSVPRDIWIKLPSNGNGGKYWKLNAAYAIGLDDADYPDKPKEYTGTGAAGRLARWAVGQVIGEPIQYYVALDFSGFEQTINTLGGVDINVEKTFDDYEYPVAGKEDDLCGHTQEELPSLVAEEATTAAELVFPCRYEHLHFDAGLQHMDGATALAYVRSRHSVQDGTDFGRAKRQRNLILAVREKIFSIGFIPKIIPFVDSLSRDFSTDMTAGDLQTLIQKSAELNTYAVHTMALTDGNFLADRTASDGQAVLIPENGTDAWTPVHTWIADSFGALPGKAPLIRVRNGTPVQGLAQEALGKLTDAGYTSVTTGNAPATSTTKTSITVYDRSIGKADIDMLQSMFGVGIVTYGENISGQQYTVDILLGTDYEKLLSERSRYQPL
ncbi:LCP family protein [Patescibacteria group bacterium]|nr:LCP family protein [Patescibacteria group bacterium]